ncbi:MAG TPA: hypothetical protein VIC33_01150, partial [Vicinamibacterales bacterium]
MRFRSTLALAAGTALLAAIPLGAQWTPSADPLDFQALHSIRAEGFQHSQVMEVEGYLTDVYG